MSCQSHPSVRDLKNAVGDARAIASRLKSFDPDVARLKDVTSTQINAASVKLRDKVLYANKQTILPKTQHRQGIGKI